MKLIAIKDYWKEDQTRPEWRWQIKAKNGKIVCASSEAFTTLAKCRKNATLTYVALWDHECPTGRIEFANEAEIGKGKK